MHPVSLFDFRVAHGIAVAAILISLVQYALQRQVLDIITHYLPGSSRRYITFAMLSGLGVATIFHYIRFLAESRVKLTLFRVSLLAATSFMTVLFGIVSLTAGHHIPDVVRFIAIAMVVAAIYGRTLIILEKIAARTFKVES